MSRKIILLFSLFLVSGLLLPLHVSATPEALNAVAITCPGEVRVGNVLSCKATGLTVGNNYLVDAVHSDGNVSRVKTASTGTEYFRFTFSTADSDGIVPVSINAASATGGYAQINNPTNNDSTYDTALVTLVDPASDIPSSFFQNILPGVLIIGIFVLLMSAFFLYKRRK